MFAQRDFQQFVVYLLLLVCVALAVPAIGQVPPAGKAPSKAAPQQLEPPWRIYEVVRRDFLPLTPAWVARMRFPPRERAFVGFRDNGKQALAASVRTDDGAYQLTVAEEQFVTGSAGVRDKYGERTSTFIVPLDPMADEGSVLVGKSSRYLLVGISLSKPTFADLNLQAEGADLAKFSVVDLRNRPVGEFVAVFDHDACKKWLVYEGTWKSVGKLSLVGPDGHSEPLLSEMVLYPYRALGLDEGQLQQLEELMRERCARMRLLQTRVWASSTAVQKRTQDEIESLEVSTLRKIRDLLRPDQAELLVRLQEQTLSGPAPAARDADPSSLDWLVLDVERTDYLPLDCNRPSVLGELGTAIHVSSGGIQGGLILGGCVSGSGIQARPAGTARYLVVSLHLAKPVPVDDERARMTMMARFSKFLIRSADKEAVGSFLVLRCDGDSSVPIRVLDLVFEGKWPQRSFLLSDADGRTCPLKPNPEGVIRRLSQQGMAEPQIVREFEHHGFGKYRDLIPKAQAGRVGR